MKRFIVLAIFAIIAGKVFATAMVHFAESTNMNTHELNHNLFLQNATDSQLKLSNIPNNMQIAKFKAAPIPTFHVNAAPTPKIITERNKKIDPKLVAANEAKTKAEAEKKEKERRKNRRKKLEEAAAKNSQAPAPAQPAPGPAPTPAPYVAANLYSAVAVAASPANTPAAPPPAATKTTVPARGSGVVSATSQDASVASWIKLLTTAPTASLMKSFVNLYKSNRLTTSQFYEVLTAMQASQDTDSRNYAVQAAALYLNISSFKLLADESQNETNATIKTAAVSDVDRYASTTYLSILQTALTSGDAAEKIVASGLIKQLSGTIVAAKLPGETTKGLLASLMNLLAGLANDSDGMVRASASQAYDTVAHALSNIKAT